MTARYDRDRAASRLWRPLLIPVLGFLLLSGGCAPVFLATGAGVGYYAGNKKAARKVNRFFHDLAESIRTSSRRTSGARQTEKAYGRGTESGPRLRLETSVLVPVKVARGEQVTTAITYAVLGAPAGGIRVEETRELWQGSRKLSLLRRETITRKNGTWESTLIFRVPQSARPGRYRVVQYVRLGDSRLKAESGFTVD